MSEKKPEIYEIFVDGMHRKMQRENLTLDQVYKIYCDQAVATNGQENLVYIKAAYDKIKSQSK
jgi:hypothetical protein